MSKLVTLMEYLKDTPQASDLTDELKNIILEKGSGAVLVDLKNDCHSWFLESMLEKRLTFNMIEEMLGHHMTMYNDGFLLELVRGEFTGKYNEDLQRAYSFQLWNSAIDPLDSEHPKNDILHRFIATTVTQFLTPDHYEASCNLPELSVIFNSVKRRYSDEDSRLVSVATMVYRGTIDNIRAKYWTQSRKEFIESLKQQEDKKGLLNDIIAMGKVLDIIGGDSELE